MKKSLYLSCDPGDFVLFWKQADTLAPGAAGRTLTPQQKGCRFLSDCSSCVCRVLFLATEVSTIKEQLMWEARTFFFSHSWPYSDLETCPSLQELVCTFLLFTSFLWPKQRWVAVLPFQLRQIFWNSQLYAFLRWMLLLYLLGGQQHKHVGSLPPKD